MFHRFTPYILTVLFVSSSVWAQSTATVASPTAQVYEQPNTKSEVLVELEKGKSVTLLGKKSGWFKIKVQLDKTFSFTGWMTERSLSAKSATKSKAPAAAAGAAAVGAGAAAAAKPAPPAPAPAAQPKSDLDRFFSPATEATPESAETFSQPETKPAERGGEPAEFHFADKARLSAGLGYILYHYALSNEGGATPGQLFAYNLPGLGIDIDGNYWFWKNANGRMKAGGTLYFQYGMYSYSTNLQDTSGTTFSTVSSKSRSYDIVLKVPLEYRFGNDSSPLAIEGNVGFEYFNFSGDDVSSDVGPLNLYVSQSTMSGLMGVFGRVPLPIPGVPGKMVLSVGSDIMLFSSVSESPSGATGDDPSASIGFKPEFKVSWVPWDRQFIDLGYRVRVQGYSFSGATGDRVGTDNVNEGKVDTAAHELFVGYEYHFR